jgi:hypothetical protein
MRDKVRRKFVCVKVIKIKNIPKKERDATKVEVDLLRRLHHPNIVRYIDSFLTKNSDSLCIAMEYCDGGDLATQIKNARRKLFSEDKVLHWFVQIALGLHYMHTNKVLHRDLKTQNIFLLGNGRLVLGDLGISKVLEGTMDFAQTCIGTPYYMSPEIFKNKPYSYKSDVWALGCVLYEMTTLDHAFDANSLNGLAQKIIKGRYPPIHNKYSRYLRELIGQMLAPEPKQRPDLDQILRKPFIRKQVVSFFVEIASRPSANLGEGTMIVRAAAGGGGLAGNIGNDANSLALKQQLETLGMNRELSEALTPKAAPQDPQEAQKMAKEQAIQLRREEEHRKMVEAALERLRLEREARQKGRGAAPAGPAAVPYGGNVKGPSPSNVGGAAARAGVAAPVGARGPMPAAGVPAPNVVPVPQGRPGAPIGGRDAAAAGGRRDPYAEQRRAIEERERVAREREAEAREAEERRVQLLREQEAAIRASEAAAKQKREREAARQQAERDQVIRREQQRIAERERQAAEIEQLRRDKEELDRRERDRERIREGRRQEERRKIEDSRRGDIPSPDYSYQDSKETGNPPRPRNSLGRAEEKDDGLSAREKMIQRKLEKQAREEQERIDALKEVEAENRRIRQQAYEQHRSLWHGNSPSQVPSVAEEEATTSRAVGGRRDYSDPNAADDKDGYQFESEGRSRRNVDLDEMTARLNEITPAGGR